MYGTMFPIVTAYALVTNHNLDLWIFKVKCDLDLWPHTWPSPWIFIVKFWNTCISEWEGWLTLHKGVSSRSLMTMTMTIWWPRSGVWIYQIVTGMTSVVGVPSTRLVHLCVYFDVHHITQDSDTWHNYLIFYNFSKLHFNYWHTTFVFAFSGCINGYHSDVALFRMSSFIDDRWDGVLTKPLLKLGCASMSQWIKEVITVYVVNCSFR